MHENNDQQLRQTQISPDRTLSSRQSSTTGYEEMERLDTTRPTSRGRRLLNLFGKFSKELKSLAVDDENLEVDNLRLRNKLNQQDTSLRKQEEALAEASKTARDHERKLTEAQQSHAEHIRELQREISILKEQVYELEKEKASSRAVANSTKVSDTVILDIWKRMAYNIRSLANTVLTRCPEEEEMLLDYRYNNETALQTTPAEYKLLADENTRSAIVECYIWRSICCGVFGSGHQREQAGAWGGIAGNTLQALCRILLRKHSHQKQLLSSRIKLMESTWG
ncbi:hypothetical protein CkaCkLH20_04303 [Colletotrichum karsti]|uniref:Uncharacterized protein n=1 Tax=Colletotrichum karsti TaxID=1095194 RepID=A0A9P6LMD2_9PEZI|nr:uncharacterized protein CkaCkLH20_04303 [Colletotrichum karsti]KAF9878265.1 hypothetical protein CkaCkLH20_04303 [Colletotrichum karsti]